MEIIGDIAQRSLQLYAAREADRQSGPHYSPLHIAQVPQSLCHLWGHLVKVNSDLGVRG